MQRLQGGRAAVNAWGGRQCLEAWGRMLGSLQEWCACGEVLRRRRLTYVVLLPVMCPQVILLMFADAQPGYHRDLLDSYTNKGAVALRNVEDDGYIVQVREGQGAEVCDALAAGQGGRGCAIVTCSG